MLTPQRWLDVARLRLRSLFKRHQLEHELDRELLDHLIEEYLVRGMNRVDDYDAARRTFGNIDVTKVVGRR